MRHGLFVGDGDEIDFVQGVERTYGVGFDATDYATWRTIGDVCTSLMARVGDVESAVGKCASQMAFYRLRRAAGPANAKARTDTRLEELGLDNTRKTMQALARCGLATPSAAGGWLTALGAVSLIGAFIALGIAVLAGDWSLDLRLTVAILVLVVMLWALPQHYPVGVETLGDLATVVARRNPMILKAQGAGLRPGAIWESLRELAADESGVPADEIFPDTPLIWQKVKTEAA